MPERWRPELERYWFCRDEGHVIVSDKRDEIPRCPTKDEWGDPCGRELFGPVVLLADASDPDDDPPGFDGARHGPHLTDGTPCWCNPIVEDYRPDSDGSEG